MVDQLPRGDRSLRSATGEFETIGVQFEIDEIAAYSEGTVGWVACRPRLVFGDGNTTTLRFTGVLHLEDGVWRSVQSHLSVGATNEETVGYEMTTTIETLAAAVQQERPDLAAATGVDGTVTIAFSDIEGSTELAVRLGDQKWLDLLRWHESVVENVVTREGGRVVKSLGDGHMLVFPSATRGLRTAIEIQRSLRQPHDGEALRLRIGLHTGEVLQHADDLFGRTVIMAARVAAAPPARRSSRPRGCSSSLGRRARSHSETHGILNSRASQVNTHSSRSSGTRLLHLKTSDRDRATVPQLRPGSAQFMFSRSLQMKRSRKRQLRHTRWKATQIFGPHRSTARRLQNRQRVEPGVSSAVPTAVAVRGLTS